MNGLMLQKQLLVFSPIVRADRHHGNTKIVTRWVEGGIHRDCHRRVRRLANALAQLSVSPSDRVGTLTWNR